MAAIRNVHDARTDRFLPFRDEIPEGLRGLRGNVPRKARITETVTKRGGTVCDIVQTAKDDDLRAGGLVGQQGRRRASEDDEPLTVRNGMFGGSPYRAVTRRACQSRSSGSLPGGRWR